MERRPAPPAFTALGGQSDSEGSFPRHLSQSSAESGRCICSVSRRISFHEVPTHLDPRGSVFEVFDTRWNWHPDPFVFAYCFTIRPGWVKGWGLHKRHQDRYFLLQGEMELVFYDVRPQSSTYGKISRIRLSAHNRRIVNVPTFVWHADHNIGSDDVMVINFPTTPYDHADPDKFRLPLDTPLIPYKFVNVRGWYVREPPQPRSWSKRPCGSTSDCSRVAAARAKQSIMPLRVEACRRCSGASRMSSAP